MLARTLAISGLLAAATLANNLNTNGFAGLDNVYSAYSLGIGSWEAGLTAKAEYGEEALWERLPGAISYDNVLLYSQDLFLALGLTNWMDIGVDVPVYEDMIEGLDENPNGFGDLGTAIKLMHPGLRPDAVIRLAYIMRATFPTADFYQGYYPRDPQYSHVSRNNEGGAFGSQGYTLNPMLAWTFDFTRLRKSKPWLVHLNFGMDALFYTNSKKKNIPQENTAMKGALVLEWLANPDWSVYLDFYGKSRLINATEGPFLEIFAKDQLDLALGVKNRTKSGLSWSLSVEGSLSTQENFSEWRVYRDDGLHDYRAQPTPIVGATFTLGFGHVGKNADSDFDGNPNVTDKCPHDEEDYDGYQDEDGCPDPVHYFTPAVAAKDTVVVYQRDTIEVIKRDTVKVVDSLQYRGSQDPNAIFGFGKTTFPAITFKTNSDVLSRTSFKTLNDIAQSLKNFPMVFLEIDGYTDNTGSDETNKALSQKRADAVVKYLVSQGIEPERLQAVGLGVENPVANNRTAAGRSLNRRVEFKRVR